jgi:DNA-binding NtrC family response regulator
VSITEPESQSAEPADKQPGSRPSNLELWVLDDDASMGDVLSSFLMERGYTVVTIPSAEEAVNRYQTQRPAAIILDVILAGPMDGLEALAAFKKIDHTVPVLVVSGQSRTATVVQAMKLGAADFLSKPFDVKDLERPLAHAIKQRQLTCDLASLRDQLEAQASHEMLFGQSERIAEVRDLLENLIKRAVVLGDEAALRKDVAHGVAMAAHRSAAPLAPPVAEPAAASAPPRAPSGPAAIAAAAAEGGNYSLKEISRTAAREAERELILRMLQQTRWNRKETAENLGISYKALLYKIKEGGLDKAS